MQEHYNDTHERRLNAVPSRPQAPATAASRPRPIQAAGQLMRFGFQIGPFHLLLTPDTFSEVVQQAVVYPLPNVPPWFLGVLNQRSHLLPVFDLHRLLDIADTQRRQHIVLILDQGSDAAGLCIDSVPQAVVIGQPRPHLPVLPEVLAAHVRAAYTISSGAVWLDVDHRRLFTALGGQITSAPFVLTHREELAGNRRVS